MFIRGRLDFGDQSVGITSKHYYLGELLKWALLKISLQRLFLGQVHLLKNEFLAKKKNIQYEQNTEII